MQVRGDAENRDGRRWHQGPVAMLRDAPVAFRNVAVRLWCAGLLFFFIAVLAISIGDDTSRPAAGEMNVVYGILADGLSRAALKQDRCRDEDLASWAECNISDGLLAACRQKIRFTY